MNEVDLPGSLRSKLRRKDTLLLYWSMSGLYMHNYVPLFRLYVVRHCNVYMWNTVNYFTELDCVANYIMSVFLGLQRRAILNRGVQDFAT